MERRKMAPKEKPAVFLSDKHYPKGQHINKIYGLSPRRNPDQMPASTRKHWQTFRW